MGEFVKYFALAFSALLPVINPVGSSLVFLGMVGEARGEVFRTLARKIAISTALFLLTMDLAGAAVLKLFGISLPVVQLAGGLVLAAMGWRLLNEKDVAGQREPSSLLTDSSGLQGRVFYPFTFPLTAGPGVLVVMLPASAGGEALNDIGSACAHATQFKNTHSARLWFKEGRNASRRISEGKGLATSNRHSYGLEPARLHLKSNGWRCCSQNR